MSDDAPQKSNIDPFAEAIKRASKRRRTKQADSVHVSLAVADVLAIRPEWSTPRAATFLHQHGELIARAMLQAGIDAVRQLAEGK